MTLNACLSGLQLEDQLSAGKEAERLLEAIGLDAASAEQELDLKGRPSKRLKAGDSSHKCEDTANRVRQLLHFLVAAKKDLEEERDQLMEKILCPKVLSTLDNLSSCDESVFLRVSRTC